MVATLMSVLLLTTAIMLHQLAADANEAAEMAKWTNCTLEPPTCRWVPDGAYSCFLSQIGRIPMHSSSLPQKTVRVFDT